VSNERCSEEQAGKEAWIQGDTSAPHWQNQLVPKCLWTCCDNSAPSVHPLCHKSCHICHHISCFGFVTLPLPGLPSCWLQQDPSQEQRDGRAAAGIAGVGRGRGMDKSGLSGSISFAGVWALH